MSFYWPHSSAPAVGWLKPCHDIAGSREDLRVIKPPLAVEGRKPASVETSAFHAESEINQCAG
jgi:hypothetical protein